MLLHCLEALLIGGCEVVNNASSAAFQESPLWDHMDLVFPGQELHNDGSWFDVSHPNSVCNADV